MLSIATLHAVDYYTETADEAFSYYGQAGASAVEADPAGTWTGKLAERFFGTGQTVTRDQFAALFFGFDPRTDEPLTKSADRLGFEVWKAERCLAGDALSAEEAAAAKARLKKLRGELNERGQAGNHRSHRPGIDLTFSAPKDFSLLVAAASPAERQALLAAWRSAVESTLATAEARYAKTRLRGADGQLIKERIAGSALALFEHVSARPARPVGNQPPDGTQPPDPDVHLHCVMFSPVLCHDEATRALFSNDLRLNLKVLDAEARARLAQALSRMGYALTEDRQKNCTSFHLAGIRPEERQRFSKRRGEIRVGLDSGEFRSSAVAAIGTRQGKGDWPRAKALAAWKAEFGRIGLTVDRLKSATAETEPRARSDEEIIEQLLSMKSYFSARELREALWAEAQFAHVPEGLDIGDWIDARANQLLKSPDLLAAQLPDGSTASRQRTASGDDEPVFTTRTLLLREMKLDDAVNTLGSRQSHRIDWQTARPIVEALERAKTEEAKAEAIAKGKPLPADFRWAYRDDQRAAIAKILSGPDVGFIQAFAGTGKTTAAAAMIEVYRAQGREVIALAPSNKAAGQLSEDCRLEGEHRALTVDAFLLGKAKDQVGPGTVLFVDEASMLSFDHAEALVKLARERGAKIIFQGDSRQLPSVARGRFFSNCIEKKLGTEAAELTVITRQREEWAKVATEAAARGDFAQTLARLDEHGAVHTEGTDEAVLDRLARDYLADPQPAHQKLIVASRNADVAALNRRIRQALVVGGQVEPGLLCMAGKEHKMQTAVGAGDRIILTDTLKEGRTKLAANGALGTVQAVSASENGLRIRLLLDGQRKAIEFDTADFSAFQHSYGISIHRSQGATVESARYLFSEFVSSELAYVAMSRHRSTFGLYCREDQKQDLARWMDKGIEKLDARDLVSLDVLNQSAAALRQRDEGLAASVRTFLMKNFSAAIQFASAKVANRVPSTLTTSPPVTIRACLQRLERHRRRLAEQMTRFGQPLPPPLPLPTDTGAARIVAAAHFPPHPKENRRPRP